MSYALVNTSNELQRVQDFSDPPPALSEAKGLRWLEYITTPPPGFDSITQKINRVAPIITETQYTEQWEVVDLDEETIVANTTKLKADKLSALAAYRYEKETGGLTLPNGMQVATDDRSKTLIVGARVNTVDNPELLTDWKAETGWVQIDAATVAYIATAIADHVRSCFIVEKGHYEAIDALTDHLDVDAYDFTTGWPE